MQIYQIKRIQFVFFILFLFALYFISAIFLSVQENTEYIVTAYLAVINMITFLVYAYDKFQAVYNRGMRVPEIFLHILEGLGGTPAAVFAQTFLNHKRNKSSFFSVTWMIIMMQTGLYFLSDIVKMSLGFQVLITLGILLVLIALKYSNEVISFAGILNIVTGVVLSALAAGYIFFGSWLTVSDTYDCYYKKVTADILNIRSEPNRKSKIVGKIKRNTKVCVTKTHFQWAYLKDKGWVAKKYLEE